ncbi:unnamed protein product, partial [Meganyctiphanes norvegica]
MVAVIPMMQMISQNNEYGGSDRYGADDQTDERRSSYRASRSKNNEYGGSDRYDDQTDERRSSYRASRAKNNEYGGSDPYGSDDQSDNRGTGPFGSSQNYKNSIETNKYHLKSDAPMDGTHDQGQIHKACRKRETTIFNRFNQMQTNQPRHTNLYVNTSLEKAFDFTQKRKSKLISSVISLTHYVAHDQRPPICHCGLQQQPYKFLRFKRRYSYAVQQNPRLLFMMDNRMWTNRLLTIPNPQQTGHVRRTGSGSLEDDSQCLLPTEDEYRASRRRSSAMSDSSRMLPTPPLSPRVTNYSSASTPTTGSRKSNSCSLETTSSRGSTDEVMRRQSSVSDADTIKIVIHDVDLDHRKGASKESSIRRVRVQKDLTDTTHRTRGLGMRVVGGKVASDGRLFAYVVWTIPAGPADLAGVCQGNKVLEWNSVCLTNRSFEEVCSIMDNSDLEELGYVDLLLEDCSDLHSLDYEDPATASLKHQKRVGSLEGRSQSGMGTALTMLNTSVVCKLKIPYIGADMLREPVTGKIQIQMWFDQETSQLIVTVVSAHDLRFRDAQNYAPPEAFVYLRLYPFSDCKTYSTGVAEPSIKPMWTSSFIWEGVTADALMSLTLELTLWDFINEIDNLFLGECLLDLRHASLDDRPTWHRLQERRSRSASATPRGSIAAPYDFQRRPSSSMRSVGSGDDDGENDSRASSMDSGLLHPDLAWRESRSSSRRGSSLSEQAENEVYQLNRSYPHSLPQSRRSSVAYQSNTSLEFKESELEARLSPMYRRRSTSFRGSSSRSEFNLLQPTAVDQQDGDTFFRRRSSSASQIAIAKNYSIQP